MKYTADIFKQKLSIKNNTLNESDYTLLDKIEDSVERNIEPLKEFVQTLVDESNILLDLFYYPVTKTESVLVLNNHISKRSVLERLCSFCDIHNIILSIDSINEMNTNLTKLGFEENTNIYINEYILRQPQAISINEGVMLFSGVGSQVKAVDLQSTNVQSYTYKQDWYKEYTTMINSPEYKKRRHKETQGVMINRNASRKRGCVSKVGFAIVGKCKVV